MYRNCFNWGVRSASWKMQSLRNSKLLSFNIVSIIGKKINIVAHHQFFFNFKKQTFLTGFFKKVPPKYQTLARIYSFLLKKLTFFEVNAFFRYSPAQEFITGLQYLTGKKSCHKNMKTGTFIRNWGVFKTTSGLSRSDISFSRREHIEYHQQEYQEKKIY